MRVTIYAVGRMKSGPERELVDRYCDRFNRAGRSIGVEFGGVVELVESRADQSSSRKDDEAQRLLDRIGTDAIVVALDETGKSLNSEKFATRLAGWRDGGARDLAIVIGGPDGHGSKMVERAHLAVSFGAMTWPHQMVRIMIAEQLYRAITILTGHPYHRQ